MINTNYSAVHSGHFSPNSTSPPQQHQGFSQQSGFGNLSLPQGLQQLISQLLQQISNFQQQNSSSDFGHNHANRDAGRGHFGHNNANRHCEHGHKPGRGQGAGRQSISSAQAFNTPVGATAPGPALTGGVYEFTVQARPGENLSFASMLAATNDQFIAPDSNGISLFDRNGQPREGDITHMLAVWDAGTEANEPVGNGPNQPSNQAGPNTGPADPLNYVRRSEEGVAPVNQLVNASLTHNGNGSFTVRLENISGQNGGGEIPITPGVAAVHNSRANPLFTEGRMDRGMGLESIAEDGDPMQLLASLQAQIGQGNGNHHRRY